MGMHDMGVDRSDRAINTSAPFVYGSPLSLGYGLTLPPLSFLSVRLKCHGTPPARLGSLSVPSGVENVLDVLFVDASRASVGTCRFQVAAGDADAYLLSLAFDGVGRVVGHSVCRRGAVGAMYAAARTAGGTLVTASGDFVLMPECVSPWFGGTMRAIEVDGVVCQADVDIRPGPGVQASETSSGVRMDLAGVYNSSASADGVTMLQIDNIGRLNGVDVGSSAREQICGSNVADPIWVGGRHVVIRHAQESNLRVTRGAAGLEIGGV